MALGDCELIAHVPETQAGHTAIVVFVDRLSKTVHFAPRWNDMGAEEFAQVLVKEIFRKQYMPSKSLYPVRLPPPPPPPSPSNLPPPPPQTQRKNKP